LTDSTPLSRDPSPDTAAARSLLTAAAVRERSHQLLEAGLAGDLDHFTVHLDRLDACADAVVRTIHDAYPSLDIPFHARWRHFAAGGHDRWTVLLEGVPWESHAAMARAAFDLAIVSVLLDAGAGPRWRYAEGRTGEVFARSEGLAVASLDMFVSGAFSSRPDDPFRVDADALLALTPEDLAAGFQAGDDNPLVGIEGRTALLNRLGRVAMTNPDIFGQADEPRPGGLFDVIAAGARDDKVEATDILEVLLAHLGPIWPGRISLGGVDLGDTWRHPLVKAHPLLKAHPLVKDSDATAGLVPFHKLSQWLSYSLIEPLQWAGYAVARIDGLTGLPEYRNGGLFLDSGVLALKDPAEAARPHAVESRLVVEWRALTVALLDRIAVEIRSKLGFRAEDFPLAKVLEGGTWATGRRLALETRGDGSPPLSIVSDGTVF
jgi:hypothetical protein